MPAKATYTFRRVRKDAQMAHIFQGNEQHLSHPDQNGDHHALCGTVLPAHDSGINVATKTAYLCTTCSIRHRHPRSPPPPVAPPS